MGSDSGVFRSADNGSGWIPEDSGLTNINVQCIAVNITNIFGERMTACFVPRITERIG